jgi:hypothetical protein
MSDKSGEKRYLLFFASSAARDKAIEAIGGDTSLLLCDSCETYSEYQAACEQCGTRLERYVPSEPGSEEKHLAEHPSGRPWEPGELAAYIIGNPWP